MSRRILLLGVPRVEHNRQLIPIERRKALALLAYLVVTRQPHPREVLAALFFPDASTSRGLAYVRNALWTLNRALGDDWLLAEDEHIAFNPGSAIEDDVQQFRAASAASEIDALTQTLVLYRGEFLMGLTLDDCPAFDDWRQVEAEALRQRYSSALERLSNLHAAQRQYDQAVVAARRWLALDSLDERAHRQLMRLYAQAGQSAAALRHYHDLERLLMEELGAAPDPETQAVAQSIQQRRAPALAPAPRPMPDELPVSLPSPPPPGQPRIFLPQQTTPFVGREEELAALQALLARPECRLITLVGQGGIGKTRLAIRAAADAAPHFPHGVYFVPLAPVCYPEFVASSVLTALTLEQTETDSAHQKLLNTLRDQQALLVLDNYEHLLESAPLIADILAHAPQVKVLVTSRERLNLLEEWLFETGGLLHPVRLNGDNLETYPAVQLFVQSAQRVKRNFVADDPAALVELCRLVEGMPLALELAATWVQVLPVKAIAQRIRSGMDVLATNTRNVPERHRSLRAVFEVSWERLTPDEQTALHRLSAFRGGFSPEAAYAAADADLPLLLALVEKSLLRRNPFVPESRFEMHELLRQYASQKASPQNTEAALRQHSIYYLGWLASLTDVIRSPQEPQALQQIQTELDNVRSAFRHAIDQRDAAAINSALYPVSMFYSLYSYLEESRELYERIAAAFEEGTSPAERLLLGRTLALLAQVRRDMGDPLGMEIVAQKAQALLQQFPDDPDALLALVILGRSRNRSGQQVPLALALVQEAYTYLEQRDDRYGLAIATYALGMLKHNFRQYEAAREILELGLRRIREIGQPSALILVLTILVESARTRGDYDAARAYVAEAVDLARLIGSRTIVQALNNILNVLNNAPTDTEKLAALENSLRLYQQTGEQRMVVWTKYDLGWLLWVLKDYERARVYQQQAHQHFREMKDLEGTMWSQILGGMIELGSGNDAAARQVLEGVLAELAQTPFPWAEAGAHYVLGELEMALANYPAARAHYQRAIRVAYEVESLLQVLRHLNGMAGLLLAEGQRTEAFALAAFVRHHPASREDARDRSQRLLEQAEPLLTLEETAAAQALMESWTLESVVARFDGAG